MKLEYPCPISRFHKTGGPASGHESARPVSVEMQSNVGPRHCGQPGGSAPLVVWVTTMQTSRRDRIIGLDFGFRGCDVRSPRYPSSNAAAMLWIRTKKENTPVHSPMNRGVPNTASPTAPSVVGA